MASRFDAVTFDFDGRDYSVPPERVMGLIDAIEDHITIAEIFADGQIRKTIRFAKISKAYAAALRYAGANTTDEDVYLKFFSDGKAQERAFEVVNAILTIMIPPDSAVETKGPKKSPKKADSASSKKPSPLPAEAKNSEDGD